MPKRILFFVYGSLSYLIFLGTFLYAICFIGNFGVPRTLDGPASGPLPASSQPATGHTPRFIAARSRRKLGRIGSSPNGKRATWMAAVRLMPRWCAAGRPSQCGEARRVKTGEELGRSDKEISPRWFRRAPSRRTGEREPNAPVAPPELKSDQSGRISRPSSDIGKVGLWATSQM